MKKIQIQPIEEFSDNFFNIKPASEFIPEWYRLSNGNVKEFNSDLNPFDPRGTTSTFKKCTPFYDGLTSGYIVELTADVEITRSNEGRLLVLWRVSRDLITEHSENQWTGVPIPEGYLNIVLKWHNQFTIKSPKGYSLLFTHPINRFDLPFQVITGIVDCDNYTLPIHFPFFVKESFTGIIPAGTPIAQIIPVKKDYWEREYLKYDKNFSFIEMQKFLSTIKRSYKNNFWERKNYK
jgi:hypothetical protein